MPDRIVLGLRADTLQETLLHELASACGAYEDEALDVDARVGPSDDGLDVGIASSLLEHAAGGPSWDIHLVACVEPLFWLAASDESGPRLPTPLAPTVRQLLELAVRRAPSRPRDVETGEPAVLGPGAAVSVATGRTRPRLDIGALARFPAVGLAARWGASDPERAERVARAHRSALRQLHEDDRLVGTVLERRYATRASDVPALAALLRRRFRPTPLPEAAALARAALVDLGGRAGLVDAAFGAGEAQA